jgi:hypothetical protein
VERAHLTLQDRLVKELRLKGISTIAQANAYALAFIEAYNARFAKPPRSAFDAHRPLRDIGLLQHATHAMWAEVMESIEAGQLAVEVVAADWPVGRTAERQTGLYRGRVGSSARRSSIDLVIRRRQRRAREKNKWPRQAIWFTYHD